MNLLKDKKRILLLNEMSFDDARVAYQEAYTHHRKLYKQNKSVMDCAAITAENQELKTGLDEICRHCTCRALVDVAREHAYERIGQLTKKRGQLPREMSQEFEKAIAETARTYRIAVNHPDYTPYHSNEEYERFRPQVPELEQWGKHSRNTRELFLHSYWTSSKFREAVWASHVNDRKLAFLEGLLPATKESVMQEAEAMYACQTDSELANLEKKLKERWERRGDSELDPN